MEIKDRILKGWTLTRVLYTVAGIAVIIQSFAIHSWIGALFGAYFTSMGVFAFGCAAGNCFGGSCEAPEYKGRGDQAKISFEEVKENQNGNK